MLLRVLLATAAPRTLHLPPQRALVTLRLPMDLTPEMLAKRAARAAKRAAQQTPEALAAAEVKAAAEAEAKREESMG